MIVNTDIIDFLKDVPTPNKYFNEFEFLMKAQKYLEDELTYYLSTKGVTIKSTFCKNIDAARSLDIERSNRVFWSSLHIFRAVRNAYAHPTNATRKTKRKWIRFINKIESIYKYRGGRIFPIKDTKNKRHVRLYIAFLICWEQLRFMSGKEDEFSPTNSILQAYAAKLAEKQNEIFY